MLNPNHGICFAKIGQAAFNPAHFVPGIGPSPDQMLQGRLFFYTNKHRHPARCPSRASCGQPTECIARLQLQSRETRCAPTATRDAREIRSHAPVHHRDDNSAQQHIGVSNANQF
jgi:Catalase